MKPNTTPMLVAWSLLGSLLVSLAYWIYLPQLAIDGQVVLLMLMALGAGGIALATLRALDGRGGNGVLMLVSIGLLLALAFTNMSVARSASYFGLLGAEKTQSFESELPILDLKDAPLVSAEMALLAARRRLSEVQALGSVAEVRQVKKQVIHGRLTWIGLLEHRGPAAWFQQHTTPGYVLVSANDPSNVELVTAIDGKPLALRYLDSAYFADDAERHVRMSGHVTEALAGFMPEIDPQGRPYLVITSLAHRVGFFGDDAKGVLTLDVQSGEVKSYDMEHIPEWVDRVHVMEQIIEQVRDRLEYVHGWFNPSKQDELRISGRTSVIYTQGGSHYLLGLTSASREGGLVGFLSVDARTKEVVRHEIAGVVEENAAHAAENVNPEKHYTATPPLPFMVAGTPAYVMMLRDSNGVARSFGIVAIRDIQHIAVSDTLSSTVRLFQTRGSSGRTSADAGVNQNVATLTARVQRIAAEVRGGNTSYALILEGQRNALFVADASLSEDLSVTRDGDTVTIAAADNGSRVRPVLSFSNPTLTSLSAHTPLRASKPASPAKPQSAEPN